MRTSNPAINRLRKYNTVPADYADRATYGGVILKSLYFAAITIVAAMFSFLFALDIAGSTAFNIILIAAPLLALVFGLIASFAPATTPITGSLYALLQGFTMGFISAVFDAAYQGVVFSALISTCGVFVIMLTLYKTGAIRVGNFFRRVMMSALLGAVVVNLVMFLVSLFVPALRTALYGNGLLAIGISVVMIIIASFMILIDLDNITRIVENGLGKRWEWVAAFGLIVTLIWLYMQFLRFFSQIASRSR